jgi:hypothetical protein
VDFTGTWDVVSSPDFDDEYLRLGGAPYVTLRQNGEFVKGEYEIGVMCGTINGGAHSDFIDFDFGGNDEMEEAFSLRDHSPSVRSRFSLADSRPGRDGDSSRPKAASLANGSRSANSNSESTEIFSGACSSAKS